MEIYRLCTPALVLALGLSSLSAAAAVSGTITDSAGKPVANALIYKKTQPTVFKKTGADGKYSLSANSGDILYVAAFKYADKQVTATAGTLNIPLSSDPALSAAVYHNNFNALRPGTGYSKADALADFNTYIVKGIITPDSTIDHMMVDPNVSFDDKGSSIRVFYPKGQITTGDSGIQIQIPLSNLPKENNFAADELYFSYWFKLGSGFELNCGGKMPGLAGSQKGNDDEKRWHARWMFRFGGSIQSYMEYSFKGDEETFLDWGTMIAPQGPRTPAKCVDELWTPYLKTNQWHHIQLRYKLNTPGQTNGIVEGWLDGTAAHYLNDKIGDMRRKGLSEDVTLNSIFFSTFYGGSKDWFKPTKDNYAWFDEFTVSTKKIPYVKPAKQR